jgi:Fe2+/Zn2+ uptake regulation proteins
MSRQMELVLQILRDSPGHMTAAQVFEHARKQLPNISLGTVYRDLGRLFDDGEIGKLVLPDGSSVYDRTSDLHGHLICSQCGKIEDIEDNSLADQLRRIAGDTLTKAEIIAEHLCPDCQNSISKS